jgi:cardiolipin synthase
MNKAMKGVSIGAALLVIVLLTGMGWFSLTRGTPVRAVIAVGDNSGAPVVTDPLFAHTLELFAGTHIVEGNQVTPLYNGVEIYPALWRDLRAARQTITFQNYFSLPSAIADTASMILRERARAGVRVLFLLDGFGSQKLTDQDGYLDSLRAANVQVAILRPVKWYNIHQINNRSHVRAVVVDGRVGHTGGWGLADYWQGDGRHDGQWRESGVRVEGPAVTHVQSMFAAAWAEATGDLITGDLYFPRETFAPSGSAQAGVFFAYPTTGSTPAERLMALTIAGARKRLWITNSYFVPDDDFRRLLTSAAHRGVDVRVLTAGPKTDVKTTTYAARARYPELMREGVRVYEYLPTMMHAKSMTVDGAFAMIGSQNFDNRSLAFNNESSVIALDAAVTASADSAFLADLAYSEEITMEKIRAKSLKDRLLEQAANLLSRML